MKITNPRTKAALHIAGAVAAVAALCALVILIGRGCQKDNDTPNRAAAFCCGFCEHGRRGFSGTRPLRFSGSR